MESLKKLKTYLYNVKSVQDSNEPPESNKSNMINNTDEIVTALSKYAEHYMDNELNGIIKQNKKESITSKYDCMGSKYEANTEVDSLKSSVQHQANKQFSVTQKYDLVQKETDTSDVGSLKSSHKHIIYRLRTGVKYT